MCPSHLRFFIFDNRFLLPKILFRASSSFETIPALLNVQYFYAICHLCILSGILSFVLTLEIHHLFCQFVLKLCALSSLPRMLLWAASFLRTADLMAALSILSVWVVSSSNFNVSTFPSSFLPFHFWTSKRKQIWNLEKNPRLNYPPTTL